MDKILENYNKELVELYKKNKLNNDNIKDNNDRIGKLRYWIKIRKEFNKIYNNENFESLLKVGEEVWKLINEEMNECDFLGYKKDMDIDESIYNKSVELLESIKEKLEIYEDFGYYDDGKDIKVENIDYWRNVIGG